MFKKHSTLLVDHWSQYWKRFVEEKFGFMGSEETISFMLKIIKWFEIHDTCNYTQAIYKRLPNKAPFTSTEDARLKWLQDFVKWLEN
jgi:hypothetical protein